MLRMLPTMFAEFTGFDFPLNEFLVLAGIIINHLANLATKLD